MKRSGNNGATTLHWRAPAVMLSSLLVGVGLAIGHHAFYASLAGTAVSSDPIKVVGWTTTQQQVNVALGTAFAFVVKASLILTCSTAYMQLLFGAISRRSFQISQLDNWFGGLNDFWSLLCVGTYWRYPLLTLGALTCWLLPLAAIISPASLSVVFDQIHPAPSLDVFVPLPAFDSLALARYMSVGSAGDLTIGYQGPNEEVSRIAFATAAQGAILPIEPPGTNSTWNVTITAPRLACADIDPYLQEDIKDSLIGFYNNVTNSSDWSDWSTQMLSYIGWCAYSNDILPTPFKNDYAAGWQLQTQAAMRVAPYTSGIGLDFFFAILPRATWDLPWQKHGLQLEFDSEPEDRAADKRTLMNWLWQDATMLHCKAVPTDMTLKFTYSGVDQTQDIQVLEMKDSNQLDYNHTNVLINGPEYVFVSEDPATATVMVGGAPPNTYSSSLPARFSTMRPLAAGPVAATMSSSQSSAIITSRSQPTLAARSDLADRPLRVKGSTERETDTSGITELGKQALRLRSWAAIQEAAMALFLGASTAGTSPGWARFHTGTRGGDRPPTFRTEVFSTVLFRSQELAALSPDVPKPESISNTTSGLAYDQAASMLANTSRTSNKPFKDVLEEVFFNITVSMASSRQLIYQPTSPLAPANVQMEQNLYGNVYSYATDKLWLAYGVAIGVTFVNLCIALVAVFRTGATFTDNFSTVVRIARNAAIEADMHEDSLPGKDPLPKHIGDAEICLRKADTLLDVKNSEVVTVHERRRFSDAISI